MRQGLDVSRYQNQPITDSSGNIIGYKPLNYQKAYDAGIRWAAVRVTVGNYYVDPCFKMNYSGYTDLGMEVHPYIVVAPRATNNGAKITAQQHWDWFIKSVKKLYDQIPETYWTYAPILDCELTRGAGKQEITALIEGLTRKATEPIIYTRASWWNPNVLRSNGWHYYRLHVANYGEDKPALPLDWDMWYAWQYSADGNGQGSKYGVASNSIDLNHVQDAAVPPDDPPPDPEPDLASRVRVTIDDKLYKIVEDTEA